MCLKSVIAYEVKLFDISHALSTTIMLKWKHPAHGKGTLDSGATLLHETLIQSHIEFLGDHSTY